MNSWHAQVAETYTAHHHKDKAATLHVVPEYEDSDEAPTPGSGAGLHHA